MLPAGHSSALVPYRGDAASRRWTSPLLSDIPSAREVPFDLRRLQRTGTVGGPSTATIPPNDSVSIRVDGHRPAAASNPCDDGKGGEASTGHAMSSRKLCQNVAIICTCGGLISVVWVTYFLCSTIQVMGDEARPYLADIMNHTMSIIENADHSSVGVATAVDDVGVLTQTALPAMQGALNQSSQIVAHLESLMAHPVMRISLG